MYACVLAYACIHVRLYLCVCVCARAHIHVHVYDLLLFKIRVVFHETLNVSDTTQARFSACRTKYISKFKMQCTVDIHMRSHEHGEREREREREEKE